ncbi:lytic murein transglycosylase [Oceanibacterium hippocampi]|uniref:Membrane-bound lytic murein transglycosylase B n=1 Tax=Oceanibacterium hippocampi TaxID=745714 RepID=A0A1Y5T484_9PROT|nr:lytic murein transglycosylase [Oceanibacterium hippocampi]SLN54856.1 Membrane-bound lytic murein transglycosylase B precursor [Oceanibacterium hippocampi]
MIATRRRSLALAVLFAVAAFPAAAAEPFPDWLQALRAEAREKGISEATLDAALAGIEPIPRVVELDRKQPEFTLTFQQYMERVVPEARIRKGREKLAENRAALEAVARAHQVQPRFIVALWGIETDFGRVTGGFKVVQALATLAYDGRRSKYFRGELLNALTILEQGHIAPEAMVGSWAGAMGQSQFMPSSFLNFAVDEDSDGRKDIWTTPLDVFGSAANYLRRSGWKDDQTWGRAVRLPAGFDPALADLKVVKPLGEWQALGLRRADGGDLPTRQLPASVVLPAGEGGPAFLVYDNYRTILKWNRSTYFAMAVGHLADAIGDR